MTILKNSTLLPLTALMMMSFNTVAKDVDKTLDWLSGGELKVDITSGQIDIRGWDDEQIKLTGEFDGDDDQLVFKTSGKDVKLEIRDQHTSWWGNSSHNSANFIVYVPFDSDLDIEGTSLEIEVNQVKGALEVNSISGSIQANGPSDRVDIESISGNIEIEDASGKVRLRTVSGDIKADVEANSFVAKTVSGDIDGRIGRSEYVSTLSVSGDVEIELSLVSDARVEGQTVSGDLEFDFVDQINADFELNTGPGGDIRNKLSDHQPEDSSHWGQVLNFTLGDGDTTIELETMSGNISLKN